MKTKLPSLTGWTLCFALSSSFSAHAQHKATVVSAVAATESVSFELYLPLSNAAALEQLLTDQQTPTSAQYHQWLTPAQVQAKFGPTDATVAKVTKEMTGFGLTVNQVSPQLLQVSGTAKQVTKALGSPLAHATTVKGRSVVIATTPVALPSGTKNAGAMLTGLSGMVRLHTHSRKALTPSNRYSPEGGYWFDDLKQAYDFPSTQVYTGKGSKIGILMSSDINADDMTMYFNHEKKAVPNIKVEPVLGGAPFSPDSDGSFEVELDVQQSGGMAPDAKITVYDIPDLSDESLVAGLVQIVEDNKVDVVSMSFGGPEAFYTAAYNNGTDYTSILMAEDELMAIGNAMGITFVASSGDQGALSVPPAVCFSDSAQSPCGVMQASAEFPASSPHVTGVGGTNLVTKMSTDATNLTSAYVSEEAYADAISGDYEYGTTATGAYWGSGGGESIVFPQPSYQAAETSHAGARTVPDLALHMGGCPGVPAGFTETCSPEDSYDLEAFAGQFSGVIGTSASAPDFAGLTALNIEKTGGRIGNENAYIYTLAAMQKAGTIKQIFHWEIPGFNGKYGSGNKGYNLVLGNGTVYGKDFMLAPDVKSAGKPQSASNP